MKRTLRSLLLAGSSVLAVAEDASACGGCFIPPSADAIVTGHRMAFALSTTRTVLWDQIEYSGAPSEFGWVLPVSPGATIEASTDAWFETLDAWTNVQVTPPPLVCASTNGGGFSCGGSDDKASTGAGEGTNFNPGVEIIHSGTVGPYETVTLRSTDAGSLRNWLGTHGYAVPPDIDPVIDAYVTEGADFIALRLIPGTGIDKMTPVRVVTPSGKAILPLRMVQAGTRGSVDIVLYVIAEGRQGLPDLTEVSIDRKALSYDLLANTTNYLTLRDQALAQNNGVSYVTAFAAGQPFSTQLTNFSSGFQTLGDAYFAQAHANDGLGYPGCYSAVGNLDSFLVVTQAPVSGGIVASNFVCGGYSDLSAALIGMIPYDVWLTRLEMRLPRDQLLMDCNVAPRATGTTVANQLQAVKATNRPAGCEEPVFESRVAPPIRGAQIHGNLGARPPRGAGRPATGPKGAVAMFNRVPLAVRRLGHLLVAGACVLALSEEAAACGGCFINAAGDSVVTGHRMAFAISPTRTVLWDQIQYTGSPSEFGWVLPITPGAVIEPSTDAWFEALEAWTAVTVTPPPLVCADTFGSGCGFGFSGADSASRAASGDFNRGVTIIHVGTVGPYETVTLRSTSPGALRTWLTAHSYNVPPEIDPVIDSYVAEGADFIALRLIPGTGVDKMTPVRVVTPSGNAILPLRMVQAGTGAITDVVLYLIAEGRYGLDDLTEVSVDRRALSFDFSDSTTNYVQLRDSALAANNGISFLTAYAAQDPFYTDSFASPLQQYPNLAWAYFAQAFQNDSLAASYSCPTSGSGLLVTEVPQSGTVAASELNCGPGSDPNKYSDLSAAFIGMHPNQTWLTRLEMRLPREALTMDCNVGRHANQEPVSNQLAALKGTNRTTFCEQPVFESRIARRSARPEATMIWGLGLLAAVGLARRIRRPRSR